MSCTAEKKGGEISVSITTIASSTKGEPPQEGLKRNINLVGANAILVGNIIGSGIFASPSSVFAQVNSAGASLIVWSGCGILAMACALLWMELGTTFPNASGGEYVYLYKAFGPLPAFLYVFVNVFFSKPATLCLISLTCGNYIITALGSEVDERYSKLVGALLLGNSSSGWLPFLSW